MSRVDEPEPFECEARCISETSAAILCRLEDGHKYWIPKSVVSDDSEVWEKGHSGKLVVQGWWAEKEGLL